MYLHNNPSPPTGSTTSQPTLPFNTTAPSATSLYNYDTNRDAFAGLLVVKGGSGFSESDPTKRQRWLSATFAQTTYLNGAPQLIFWSAAKEFKTDNGGAVNAYLAATNGTLQAWLISGTVAQSPWSPSGTWTQRTITFSSPGGTIPAGYWLELLLIVDSSSGDDLWFAYDTTAYPSRIVWP